MYKGSVHEGVEVTTNHPSIPDVQGILDTRQIAINRVGIRGIRHPIRVASRDGEVHPSVGRFSMYVGLPPELKGTHMSRFIEIINSYDEPIDDESFGALLRTVAERLNAQRAYVELSFPYFVTKVAPVSGISSALDYEVTLRGEYVDGELRRELVVVVPVTSLCPCSKEISEYGAHNQRAHVTVAAEWKNGLQIEDVVNLVEGQASSQLYGVLKRVDEKFVTERAYENPKFVEDMVRDVAAALRDHELVGHYSVEVENFESIHNHSVYAMINGDRRRG